MSTPRIAAQRKRELIHYIRKMSRKHETFKTNRKALIGDESVDIDVNVEALYNPLSMPNRRLLAGEIYDFIEESASLLAYLVPIRVVLHGVPAEERAAIPGLIRAHYEHVLEDRLWDKRENTINMIGLFIVGILVLGIYLGLAINREDSIFIEVLSVLASFALWSGADCYMLKQRKIKREILKTAQFLTMEVAFED